MTCDLTVSTAVDAPAGSAYRPHSLSPRQTWTSQRLCRVTRQAQGLWGQGVVWRAVVWRRCHRQHAEQPEPRRGLCIWQLKDGWKHLQCLHQLRVRARTVLRSELDRETQVKCAQKRAAAGSRYCLCLIGLGLEYGLDVRSLRAAAVMCGCCCWRLCCGGCARGSNAPATIVRERGQGRHRGSESVKCGNICVHGGKGWRGGGTFLSRRVFSL